MKAFIISILLLTLLTSCYGAQQTINIGTTPSDGTGDSLRAAFGKVNANFTELYSLSAAINASNITSGTLPIARIADGSVTNAKLLNSSITINGSAVSLGQSIDIVTSSTLHGLTDVTITGAATNDFLVKSAGDWVNLTPANARTALGLSSAGGVLSGSYPNPGFAVDMAEQSELNNALLSLSASNLTSGTLPIARIADGSITLAKLASAAMSDGFGGASDSGKLVTFGTGGRINTANMLFVDGSGDAQYESAQILWQSGPWSLVLRPPVPLSGSATITLPAITGTLIGTGDTGTVTNTMLAGSIANNKLANSSITINGTPVSLGGSITVSSGATLGANTFTGLQQFSGTTHAGLRLNNLTTTQRDALTGGSGMIIWNTTDGRMQLHNGTGWTAGMVRLDGDTMTGALSLPAGSVSAPSFNVGDAGSGVYRSALNEVAMTSNGTQRLRVTTSGVTITGSLTIGGGTISDLGSGQLSLPNGHYAAGFGFSVTPLLRVSASALGGGNYTQLRVIAANTGMFENGTSGAQAIYVANTRTSDTNYEAAGIWWSSNVALFGPVKGSGGGTARRARFHLTETVWIGSGSGSPEGVQTAGIGSLYTDEATGTLYRKTSGTGNTGWVTP